MARWWVFPLGIPDLPRFSLSMLRPRSRSDGCSWAGARLPVDESGFFRPANLASVWAHSRAAFSTALKSKLSYPGNGTILLRQVSGRPVINVWMTSPTGGWRLALSSDRIRFKLDWNVEI